MSNNNGLISTPGVFVTGASDSNIYLRRGEPVASPIAITNNGNTTVVAVDGAGNTTIYNQQSSGATRFGNETGEFFFDNLVSGNPSQIQNTVNLFVNDAGDANIYTNNQSTVAVQIASQVTGNVKYVTLQPNPANTVTGNPAGVMLIQASPVPIYRPLSVTGSNTTIELDSSWAGKMNILNVQGTGTLTLDFDGIQNKVAGMMFTFIYQTSSSNTTILLDSGGTVGTVTKTARNQVFTVYYDGSAFYPIVPVTSF